MLEPDSELTILAPKRSGGGLLNRFSQSFGTSFAQFSSLAKGGGRYEIETPAGIVAVRDGAVIRVGIGRSPSGKTTVQVVVLEGEAELRPQGASEGESAVVVGAGETVTATEGEAIPEAEAFVPENDIVIRLFSPFWMLVAEPGSGLSHGAGPAGDQHLSDIRCRCSTADGVSPQTVRLNEVVPGTYTIYLLPKTEGGDFTVTADGRALKDTIFADSRSGTTKGCEWFYLLLDVDIDPTGLISFGELQGPFSLAAIPAVYGRKVESPARRRSRLRRRSAAPRPPRPPRPRHLCRRRNRPPSRPRPPNRRPYPRRPPSRRPPPQPTVQPTPEPQVEEPPPPPPPPEPTPDTRPRPNIDIEHVEESIAGPLPGLPTLLVFAPAVALAVAGAIRRRGGGR